MKNGNQAPSFLGGMTINEFLQEYWQKKPLFIKGAFPSLKDPLTPETIAGLTLEEFIPSRLIIEREEASQESPQDNPWKTTWELHHGPLESEQFTKLPPKKWMVVVNDLEKFLPHLQFLLEPFSFIPRWRFDDLQVTYGPDEGNVGPHWDDYDVFLLQGRGKKRWQISYDAVSEDDFIEGPPIRLIENFTPHQEWLVETGDLLYLPPRIGHYGVNVGKSVTWSIGYRMPKINELFHEFSTTRLAKLSYEERLTDKDLAYQSHSGELSHQSIAALQHLLQERFLLEYEEVGEWFGRFLTEPKMYQEAYPLESFIGASYLANLLIADQDLERHPGLPFIYSVFKNKAMLFVAGEAFSVSLALVPLLQRLTEQTTFARHELLPYFSEPEAEELLVTLFNEGYLLYEGVDDE